MHDYEKRGPLPPIPPEVSHALDVLGRKPPDAKLTDEEKAMVAETRDAMDRFTDELRAVALRMLAEASARPPRRWWQFWKGIQ